MNEFQAFSSARGREFEAMCGDLLASTGWTLMGKKRYTMGVEADQVAERDGVAVNFEFKGGMKSRTCCLKKAICNGALLKSVEMPFWVVAFNLPKKGAGKSMMAEALALGYVTRFMTFEELEEDGKAN